MNTTLNTLAELPPAAALANGIRNPLAAIRAQVELLREQTDEMDPRRESLDRTIDEIEQISQIVESIVEHGASPECRLRNCDLGATLADATGSLLVKAERRGVSLRREGMDREIPFRTDPDLLGNAVRRLLENAIDATPEGGEAQIFLDTDVDGFTITIVDHGKGMTEKELGRLGEAFFSGKAKGLGLGALLAQRSLRLLDAQCEFRSRPGEGTTVQIRSRGRGLSR